MTAGSPERKANSAAKFRLLMWKNFLLQWRHPYQTVAELLVPVLAMSLIMILRSQIEPSMEPTIEYPPIPAHSLFSSGPILLYMRVTQMSVAYSPTNSYLEDIVKSSVSKMLTKNIGELMPIIGDLFPGINPDIISGLDPAIISELLKRLIKVNGYDSAEDLRGIYANEEQTRKVIAAVEFPDSFANVTVLPAALSYNLRFPERPRQNSFFFQGGRSWRTRAVFPAFTTPGPRMPYSPEGGNDPGYVNEMFIALQHSISMEIIYRITGQDKRDMAVQIQRYPHPEYAFDMAVQVLIVLFPLFIILSFTFTAVNLTRAVAVEKEMQIKEAMKIMGLPTWLHWTAWFCKQFLFLFIVAILIVLLLKINWFTTEAGFRDYAVFTRTPWTVLFFFLIIYLISVIFLCFMVSSFFSKASTAALFMGVMWFIMYIPSVLLSMDESVSVFAQVMACFSLNTAMSYGFQLLLAEEMTGGMQWRNFFYSPSDNASRLLFGHIVLITIIDGIIYFLITLYLEQVMPGPYGTAQPWNFLFKKDFWVGSKTIATDDFYDKDNVETAVKENDPTNHSMGVKISNLTKKFESNTAVNNLSLNIFNDQITVLLGHNGAGKSTTISMLTGNISPSYGSIWLAGYDMRRQLSSARSQVGLCPQHNVLFAELTVREHLEFFARLKGLTGYELANEIDTLIEKLELQEKRDYQSAGLSGGQKRRLSVGIALCGGAKVVLLDEPTSGMDPSSRRALWDLLEREKKGRSMILTTHFMDEADYLGDRIAIMSSGRLQCVGSPFFLKRHYGVGYSLVVIKQQNFNVEACIQLITKYIPKASITEDKGMEVIFALSNDFGHVFEEMLTDLESNMLVIGFKNYGLTATTIEDVFMAAGSDVVEPSQAQDNDESHTPDNDDLVQNDSDEFSNQISETTSADILASQHEKVTGCALLWQHTYAMWLKLYLIWSRSWGLLLLQILVPITIMNITLAVVHYMITLIDSIQPRNLTLAQGFTRTETLLGYNNMIDSDVSLAQAYSSLFQNNNMQLTMVENQTVDDYYFAKGADIVQMGLMRTQLLIGATFSNNIATAWFSNFGYHDVAISLATLHSAILKSILPNAELNVTNYPLEANYENSSDVGIIAAFLSMQFAMGVGNSISIVSAVFIMFYIKERISRAKLLQKASGVEPIVMWGSAALFDWLWFLLISLTFIISCTIFQVIGLSSAVELGRLFLLLMVYGMAMLPLNYVLSYLFSGPTYGFVVLIFANALFGTMGSQIVEALWSLDVNVIIPESLDRTMQFFPLYSLVSAVKLIHQSSIIKWSCMQACDFYSYLPTSQECNMEFLCTQTPTCCVREDPYFDWQYPGVLRYIVSTLVTCVVCWVLLMFFEYRIHHKIWNRKMAPPSVAESTLDEDVVLEQNHVKHIGASSLERHNLVAREITKYYGKHLAVNQVSFSVGEMECFGLLGVNGAGKTTTFKMLMGDERITRGDAFVRGHSVTNNIKQVHENIGYCPQFDAVFNEMTGRETLRFFALLRGLRPHTIKALTDELSRSLGFTKHLDKRVFQYSGGNKRKLSTAVALMGYARVVYLDEPTTGVDPAAKRQVWRAVKRATQTGRSVVLTSHSMEECEALCSRITIMVNGQFQCLGTPQHLKNKFSEGFTLTIKLKLNEDNSNTNTHNTSAVKDYVTKSFLNPKLMEEYQGLLTYYLPERSMPWPRMFGIMERAKQQFHIEDYNISQTTLEQIFLQFTKYQNDSSNLAS